MSNKKKQALVKQINETKAKIAALHETNSPKSLGVAVLIESSLERDRLILAAENITDELQKMATRMVRTEADDLMPLVDEMKKVYGAQAGEAFYTASRDALRRLIDQLQNTKGTIQSELERLQGGQTSDMSMAGADVQPGGATEADLDAIGGEEEAPDLDMGGEEDFSDEEDLGGEGDLDMGGEMDDMGDGEMTSAAGRARKPAAESLSRSDRVIFEAFKRAMKEGRKPTAAAWAVAEKYQIDLSDVREIVKEGFSKRKVNENWKKKLALGIGAGAAAAGALALGSELKHDGVDFDPSNYSTDSHMSYDGYVGAPSKDSIFPDEVVEPEDGVRESAEKSQWGAAKNQTRRAAALDKAKGKKAVKENAAPMKTYEFDFGTAGIEVLKGTTPQDALKRAGYGGDVNAANSYREVKNANSNF